MYVGKKARMCLLWLLSRKTIFAPSQVVNLMEVDAALGATHHVVEVTESGDGQVIYTDASEYLILKHCGDHSSTS